MIPADAAGSRGRHADVLPVSPVSVRQADVARGCPPASDAVRGRANVPGPSEIRRFHGGSSCGPDASFFFPSFATAIRGVLWVVLFVFSVSDGVGGGVAVTVDGGGHLAVSELW